MRFDEIYQLAADMGGAGYIFTGENDAAVMHNSALINLNMLEACQRRNSKRIFYSSSACIYPEHSSAIPTIVSLPEDGAYPAAPDSEYGWEKLFSERLYMAFQRNHGFDVRIARYHNIFGPEGRMEQRQGEVAGRACPEGRAWRPMAASIEIWGDGLADPVVPLHRRMSRGDRSGLMRSELAGPVNIGSDEMVTINGLATMLMDIARQEARLEAHSGTARRARAQFGQQV